MKAEQIDGACYRKGQAFLLSVARNGNLHQPGKGISSGSGGMFAEKMHKGIHSVHDLNIDI
ncbi:TPA: hypothetical protein ACOEEB_002614 [Enterobacter asburiae]